MVEKDFVPGFGVQRELRVASDFLAEVHHQVTAGRAEHLLCGNALGLAHEFALLGDQDVLRPVQQPRRLPRPFNIPFKARVIGLAVVDFTEADRALAHTPRLVCDDALLAAVRIPERQERNQAAGPGIAAAFVIAVDPARHGRAEPAASHRHPQIVLRFQQIRHVIGLHLQPVIIAGPAGRHHEIPDPLAIQFRFVYAERRDL